MNKHSKMGFNKIDSKKLSDNFIRAIGDEWLLITAGTIDSFNTMTASWGSMGVLWNKPSAICFIRPTRHTFQFAETSDIFTLSFFTEKEREILQFCGTKSGRDHDKIAATGLKPFECENSGIGFSQARLIIECKKMYFDDLKPENFLVEGVDEKIYPKKDYHRMYVGGILECYQKQK